MTVSMVPCYSAKDASFVVTIALQALMNTFRAVIDYLMVVTRGRGPRDIQPFISTSMRRDRTLNLVSYHMVCVSVGLRGDAQPEYMHRTR
jgi:hypothetical protein